MYTQRISLSEISTLKFMAVLRGGKGRNPVKARAVTWLKSLLNQHYRHLP
jgi:hypothetical protein